MLDNTLSFYIDNNATLSQIPALVTDINKLKSLRSDMDDTIKIQVKVLTGITLDKKRAKANCIKHVAKCSRAVYSYAHSNENDELTKEMDFSYSELLQLRDEMLVITAENVFDAATLHAADIVDSGIDAAELVALEKSIKDFKAIMGNPKKARDARKTCTAKLKVLFPDAMNLLKNEIDNLIYVTEDEDLISGYKNARNIIDYRSKRNKPAPISGNGTISGVISNSVDSSFIEDAIVTIVELNMSVTSDEEGEYYFENVPAGTYKLKCTAYTYVTETITDVEVLDNANTDQDIDLNSDESNTTSAENTSAPSGEEQE